ncbi:adenylosuccinate lyase [Solidesulfovibrio carbinoliphilus subsp. oakridgensis]|uniref:Adenylosuccinate lyase n=1 Tax=Solidesulfovibrio carbinoliphilus subsp. oakridgensis TaxID=694327 RepID=G7Q5A2_9BACT|nr:adenylosuccinate lyase [Solidesulfovibrio carbinoliphilus]EHJ48425.1 adenylosuccinate lyase [Solidesulfovibrio carbinoliphilus subsp. oakridgensis]
MIDRYTRKAMGELWSLENKFRAWLEVELAVCEAWTELGRIPAEDMAVIREQAGFNVARILEIEEVTRHDVIAFLTAVEEQVGPSARYIHLGCTSSDIVDTANGLLLGRAGDLILAGIDHLLTVIKDLAMRFKGQLMMGRTHGIHAEPLSFGMKMASFYAEFSRHRARVARALSDVKVGKISGAVGGYAHLDPRVESIALARLGLAVDPISTQIVQRDRHAAFFTSLALLAGGVERMATELRHLQRTEVLEAEEGFAKGQKGSSAMPHKKNPISAENICGLSRLVRTNALASMENMPLWHERDISHSSVERVIMPDSTILADYIVARLAGILANLQVNPDNMARNMMASYGLFYSQRVLLALIDAGMERQKAYETVQAVAMACWAGKRSFPDAVRADPAITEKLGSEVLSAIFDPSYYLEHEDLIFSRVFGQAADGAA